MQGDSHMKKAAVIVFALLIFVNGLLLTFQFHVFSDKVDNEQQTFKYNQVIDIVHRGNQLIVTQTFTDLPESNVIISWPEKIKNKKCVQDAKGKPEKCDRMDQTLTQFKEGTSTTQKLQYVIPLAKGGIQSRTLLANKFLTLKHGVVSHTQLHISDEERIGGQWFTGLPRVATRSLALTDYSYYQGTGAVYELYWQKTPLKKAFTNDRATVYGGGEMTQQLQDALVKAIDSNTNHVDVIHAEQPKNGVRIIFAKSIHSDQLPGYVAVNVIKQKYSFSGSDWLPTVVASILDDSVYGATKTRAMLNTLYDYMSESQLKEWKAQLQKLEGKKVTNDVLDQTLSESLDATTSYFAMNGASKGLAPLLFEDGRSVYVNDVQQKNMRIILKDGRVLYAATPLFDTLGYTAKTGKNGYYVKNAKQSYRFPMTSAFYVFNNKRYDIASQPFEVVNGQYYVEEAWLIRLFGADIQKLDERIDINISDEALK